MSMAGYTKLFSSILASTIWREDDKTRIVWITMLAMADKNGIAEGSIPGLADFARVTVKDCRKAITKLSSPDPDSRTPEFEGRRIEPVDGGWKLLNHAKYRAKLNADERREYLRKKQAEHRAKSGGVNTASTDVNKCSDSSTESTHAEAAPEAYTKADGEGHAPTRTLSASERISLEKEMERGIKRQEGIRKLYNPGEAWSEIHRTQFKSVKDRITEIKQVLGCKF